MNNTERVISTFIGVLFLCAGKHCDLSEISTVLFACGVVLLMCAIFGKEEK